MMRYELTDHEWAAIEPMLPNKARFLRPAIKLPQRLARRSAEVWAEGLLLKDEVVTSVLFSHASMCSLSVGIRSDYFDAYSKGDIQGLYIISQFDLGA
jgi:hypothetical protein